MNRRLSAAIAVVLVAAGVIGAVGADRVVGSSSDKDVLRDAWSAHDGRAVVEMSAADVDFVGIADSTRILIAVRPIVGQQHISIPLQRQKQVTVEPVNQSRSDLVLPALAVRGEKIEPAGPMDAGRYEVVAIRDGERIDATNLTVYPAAVNGNENHG